jgi:hypothetical protein
LIHFKMAAGVGMSHDDAAPLAHGNVLGFDRTSLASATLISPFYSSSFRLSQPSTIACKRCAICSITCSTFPKAQHPGPTAPPSDVRK